MLIIDGWIIWGTLKFLNKAPKWLEDNLRERKYRTPRGVSYRQINGLEKSNVIRSGRENKKGWRAFNLKELVYLRMIVEARKYGIENKQLENLKRQMYERDVPLFTSSPTVYEGEIAIMATMAAVRITWVLFSDGNSAFVDLEGLVKLLGDKKPERTSYLLMNLNELVLDATRETLQDADFIKVYPSFLDEIKKYKDSSEPGEVQLLEIIKNKDYSKVTIIKTSGQEMTLYAEKLGNSNITSKEILELIESKDFVDLSVKKRDGKIVRSSSEDVYKLPLKLD